MLSMLIKEIRKQIKNSGKSLNQIDRDTGIDKAALSRIMNGGSCKVETADILFKYFRLEVVFKKIKKTTKKRGQKNESLQGHIQKQGRQKPKNC